MRKSFLAKNIKFLYLTVLETMERLKPKYPHILCYPGNKTLVTYKCHASLPRFLHWNYFMVYPSWDFASGDNHVVLDWDLLYVHKENRKNACYDLSQSKAIAAYICASNYEFDIKAILGNIRKSTKWINDHLENHLVLHDI